MAKDAKPATRELGYFYEPSDYAGIFRRALVIVIDLAALVGSFIAVSAIDAAVHRDETRALSSTAVYSWLIVAYLYLVILEASSIGTLGFMVAGVKIVTLDGRRPSFIRMTFRLFFWILGPINALVDLFWLTGDEFKQTLRDKFSGTLVIRKNAKPAGSGAIRLNRYQFLGYSFVFFEVDKPTSA